MPIALPRLPCEPEALEPGITRRVDDVVNVSGHRLDTAELESALVSHPEVAEAAVVGIPHAIKGQGIYAYVTLKPAARPSEALRGELQKLVCRQIGRIAALDHIQWAAALPRTRSGMIMRRILRRIAEDGRLSLDDVSTLLEPAVLDALIRDRHVPTQVAT